MNSSWNSGATDERLRSILQAGVGRGFPGMSMAIASDGDVIWCGTAGHANLERDIAMQDHNLLGIGSITKTYVAVLALQLADEGKLDLESVISNLLPSEFLLDVFNADDTKVRHLLNHTSGIPTWEFNKAWIKDGRGASMDLNRVWGKTEAMAYLHGHQANRGPSGERYSYSNTNHTLLGLIIEHVSGNELVDEIRDRILRPLCLVDTFLNGFEPVPSDRLACGYHLANNSFVTAAGVNRAFPRVTEDLIRISGANWSVEWAAGGLQATASDLARFADAGIHCWSLGDESVDYLHDFQATGIDGLEVGHGIFRRFSHQVGRNILTHGGDVLGYSGTMGWFEDGRIAWSILTNRGTMHSYEGLGRDTYLLRDFVAKSGILPALADIDTEMA